MLNAVHGNFSGELPLRHARSRHGLQNDPRFVAWAVELLAIAVQEETGARSSTSPEWRHYSKKVTAAQSGAPLSSERFRALLREIPDSASVGFQELSCVLSEPDRQNFAEFAWRLARRHLEENRFPQVAHALLTFAAEQPSTRARALPLLRVLEGGGSFFQQVEFQGPRLLGELVNPLFLGSFALAGIASRGVSLAVLSRVPRFSWAAFGASEAAAWAVEVPTLVLSHRLGMQLFAGGNSFWKSGEAGQEMLATAGPFLFLRIASNAFSFAAPALRRPLLDANGRLAPWREGIMQGARWGTELIGMMAGNAWNASRGFAPSLTPWENFQHSFLSVGHMRLAGHLIHRAKMDGLSSALAVYKSGLMQERSISSQRPSGPWADLLGSTWAFAGMREMPGSQESGVRGPRLPEGYFMAVADGGERNGGGGKPKEPGSVALLLEILHGSLQSYRAEVGLQETLIAKVARNFERLLARFKDPSQQQDAAFIQELEQLKEELARARAGDSAVRSAWESLRVLLRHYSSSMDANEQAQARTLERELEQSGDEVVQTGRELDSILGDVSAASRTDRARAYLSGLGSRLTALYKMARGRLKPETHSLSALQGTLWGLSARGTGTESFWITKELGDSPRDVVIDRELEAVHRAMYFAAFHSFHSSKAQGEIHEASTILGVPPKSLATMVLTAEALQHLSEGTLEPQEFLAALKRNPASRPLQEELQALSGLYSTELPLEDILPILSPESAQALASDYFLSGLLLLLRSGGSPDQLTQDLRTAGELRPAGFHPSIALGFFGAAYGVELLPREFLPPAARVEALFRRTSIPPPKK